MHPPGWRLPDVVFHAPRDRVSASPPMLKAGAASAPCQAKTRWASCYSPPSPKAQPGCWHIFASRTNHICRIAWVALQWGRRRVLRYCRAFCRPSNFQGVRRFRCEKMLTHHSPAGTIRLLLLLLIRKKPTKAATELGNVSRF